MNNENKDPLLNAFLEDGIVTDQPKELEQCEGCKGDEVIEVPQFAAKDGKGPDWDGIEKFIVNEINKFKQSPESITVTSAKINKEKKQGEICGYCGYELQNHEERCLVSQQEATIKQLQNRNAELEKDKDRLLNIFDKNSIFKPSK